MKKETAVEWLSERLKESGLTFMSDELKFIDQAKTMEKEQIMDAYSQGTQSYYFGTNPIDDKETYYNETYNNKEK